MAIRSRWAHRARARAASWAACVSFFALAGCAASGGAAGRGDKLTATATSDRAGTARAETAASPLRRPEAPRDLLGERARQEFGVGADARDLDAEVLAVLDAFDRAQVELGIQARTYASEPRVRALTERLMVEHAQAIVQRARVSEGLGARPRESALSARVSADSNAMLARLGRLRGAVWDAAYLNAVVAHHARTLGWIDLTLAPVVTAPALRALLANDVRPRAAQDLERSQVLQNERRGATGH